MELVADGFYVKKGSKLLPKVAGFDLDWTLARPIKTMFPAVPHDWAMLPRRLKILRSYIRRGYSIVIFTNQGWKGRSLTTSLNRVTEIDEYLISEGIDAWILAATENNKYRKPKNGMWRYLHTLVKFNTDTFYCGDAAGRPSDFSDSDKEFAESEAITFYTPEEIFPNLPVVINDPKIQQTMYLFVGMPGTGKTTFYETYLQPLKYVHISQDELKTFSKMLKTVKANLSKGKSIAVDATNPIAEKRAQYIELARKYNVVVLIIYFVGNGTGFNGLRDHPVPDVAYHVYFSRLEEPSLELDGVPVIERE